LEAIECISRHPEEVIRAFLGEEVEVSDFTCFMAGMRPVLERSLDEMATQGLENLDRFARDLIASPEFAAQCVCQDDGGMIECPDKPVLSAGAVEPDSGDASTVFAFSVHYRDDLGDPPDFVRVKIDRDEHDMVLLTGEPTDGCYGYSTGLPPGFHTYWFTCRDTSGAGTRFPASGPVGGPFVATSPVLWDGSAKPARGSVVTDFTYSVQYHDPDGQAPLSVRVYIDGEPREMDLYHSGSTTRDYRLVTRLAYGPHDYYFLAQDSSGFEVRDPAEGSKLGPYVDRTKPELSNGSVSPAVGTEGERFTYRVAYFDFDGDAPLLVNVCYDGTCQNMRLESGVPSNGAYSCGVVLQSVGRHTYHFACTDRTGLTARLPETGEFDGPLVERAPGGQPNLSAKVAVHVIPYKSQMNCGERLPEIESCWDIQFTYEGDDFLAFPVFFDLNEYQGVEFGLSWPDWAGSAAWHSCSDLAIGDISHPGDGVSQVWRTCHLDHAAVTGWVWLHADGPGYIYVCPHPHTQRILVLNCRQRVDEAHCSAAAGVNGFVGDDPCRPTLKGGSPGN
jgi:hypothetical protein